MDRNERHVIKEYYVSRREDRITLSTIRLIHGYICPLHSFPAFYGRYRNPGACAHGGVSLWFDLRLSGVGREVVPLELPWTYLVSQLGRVHRRIPIRLTKLSIATGVLPSVRDLISGGGQRIVRNDE